MAVDPELLALLVCPKTRGKLEKVRLPEPVARRLEEKFRERMAGEPTVIEEGLYSREARLVYPIVSDIPVMLIDEAFPSSEIGKE